MKCSAESEPGDAPVSLPPALHKHPELGGSYAVWRRRRSSSRSPALSIICNCSAAQEMPSSEAGRGRGFASALAGSAGCPERVMHHEPEALCSPRSPVLLGNPLIHPTCLCFQRLRKLLISRSVHLSVWTIIFYFTLLSCIPKRRLVLRALWVPRQAPCSD